MEFHELYRTTLPYYYSVEHLKRSRFLDAKRVENPRVVGSIPTSATTFSAFLRDLSSTVVSQDHPYYFFRPVLAIIKGCEGKAH